MRKSFLNHRGFTFVETLITFSIVGIFLLLTWGTVQFLIAQSNQQLLYTRAHFLVVEGIEIVKQIRSTAVNRNRETGFIEMFGDKEGQYILLKEGEEFFLESGDFQQLEMQEEPYTLYCRSLEITGDDPKVKKVRSRISWGAHLCEENPHSIVYSTFLTALKK